MKLFKNKLCFLTILSLGILTSYAQKTKVACLGNSVTYEAKIKEREINSYPAQLQKLLGDDYLVRNFGHSGATALKKGHKPYWIKSEFEASKKIQPNIVIIHLGLNDQGMNNWPNHKDEFVDDYIDLINTYKALPIQPKIIICKMSPTFSGHHWFEQGMRESFKEIQTKIEKIAQQENVQLINLHEPLYRFPELFPDQIHPQKKGASIIANKVFSAITGDFGGLKLAPLYGEKMVLQRNEPIVILGMANANDELKIKFIKEKRIVKVSGDGQWKVKFPAVQAGGPYKLEVTSKQSEDISIKEVYVGEVWLASGQSNMDFKVKSMATGYSITIPKAPIDDSATVLVVEVEGEPNVTSNEQRQDKDGNIISKPSNTDFREVNLWKVNIKKTGEQILQIIPIRATWHGLELSNIMLKKIVNQKTEIRNNP